VRVAAVLVAGKDLHVVETEVVAGTNRQYLFPSPVLVSGLQISATEDDGDTWQAGYAAAMEVLANREAE